MSPALIVRRQILTISWLLLFTVPTFAAERPPTELLPDSTVVFAEIRDPQKILDAIYDHELVGRIEKLAPVREAMEKKPYLDFKAGVAIVESQMGMPWRKVVGRAIGGGVVVAADAKTKGVALLARATDDSIHAKLLETLANLANFDAKGKGNPEPVQTVDYEGVKVYKADKSRFAVLDGWLVITNNDDLGKQIFERIHGKEKPVASLADDKQFAKAKETAGDAHAAWAYINTGVLREAGVAKKLFGGQAENPFAELMFGGILNALKNTPYVCFRLDGDAQQLRASACAPYDHEWSKDRREFFFGPDGKGTAPPKIVVDDTILSIASYRDISGMWLRAGDLFDERMNEELTKAEANLTTLFGGKDFGEDILGAIKPEVQFVIARQMFPESAPVPTIKLPSFGLVAELKDPEEMQPELRRTFQSLVGFLNIVGAMNGQPQLDMDMEKTDAAQFITANYIADAKSKDGKNAKITYNFSPSIGFAGPRFVIASTKAFAHALVASKEPSDKSASDAAGKADRVVNTDAVFQLEPLRAILADNRPQLVAQNMLKEGHSKDEAERDVGLLLEAIGWLDHMNLSLDSTRSELRLSLAMALTPVGQAEPDK